MTELAVKQFFKVQLETGIETPVPLAVYRQRPKSATTGDQAVVIVTQSESMESRMTVNRPLGQKIVERNIVVLIWLRYSDEQAGGDMFDLLKEECAKVIRGVEIPQDIFDPETNSPSRLLFVGERIRVKNNEPVQDENIESSVIFACAMIFPVTEIING